MSRPGSQHNTYEGWQKLGRQVIKGQTSFTTYKGELYYSIFQTVVMTKEPHEYYDNRKEPEEKTGTSYTISENGELAEV